MTTFNIFEKMQIDLIILRLANDRAPKDEACRLADYIDEDVIREGLRLYFCDEPEWDDKLLPAALKLYYATEAVEAIAQEMADDILGGLVGSLGLFRL